MKKLSALLLAVLLVSLVAVPRASAALPPKPTEIIDVTGNATGTTGLLDWNGPYMRLLRHMTDKWVWPDWSDSYTAAGEQVDISAVDHKPAGSTIVTVHDTGISAILIDQYGREIGNAQTEADFSNAVVFPDAQPGTKDGRTLAPIRFLFENMGYQVIWTKDKPNEVWITGKGHDIRLWFGEKRATVDGQEKVLDVAPLVWHDRTYLPLRFLFESVGAVVGWDNQKKFAWIWTDPNDPSLEAARRDSMISLTTEYAK